MEKSARNSDPHSNSDNTPENSGENSNENNSGNSTENKPEKSTKNTPENSFGSRFRNIPFLKIAWPVLIIMFSCMVYMGYSFISSLRPGGDRYVDYAAKFDSLAAIQADTISPEPIDAMESSPSVESAAAVSESRLDSTITETGSPSPDSADAKPVVGLGQKFRFILALILILVVPLMAILSIGLTKFKKGYGDFWTACVIMLPLIGSLAYFTLGRSQRIK